MRAWFAPVRTLSILAVAALVMSGCASLPTPGSRLDVDELHNAIVADRVEYVRAAIEARVARVNERIPAPVYAEGTPLITIAARAGSVEVVRYLIKAGADINARTPAHETALMLAAYFRVEDPNSGSISFERHEKVAQLLVEAGATLENEPYNYTPLGYAAYQGHDHIIRFLIQRGARVNGDVVPGPAYVNTPLMMAAMQGHQSSAVLLLRAGADARIRVQNGHTASELAAKYAGNGLVPLLQCAERAGPGEGFLRMCERAAR
jgi:hypothetical protein